MRVDRYFSSTVRIQFDRGQRVISDGPYRFVRHPGYTAALVIIVSNGVAQGPWLAAAISWIGIPILLRRTAMENAARPTAGLRRVRRAREVAAATGRLVA